MTGLEAGEFVHTPSVMHLYLNLEQADTHSHAPYLLPRMRINPARESIFDFVYEDFELTGYQSHGAIRAPVAV